MAQVGLKDVHIAILEEDTKDELNYELPETVVGAINAVITPTVNTQELYADDQLWESVSALGKIDVEVETADLPLKTRAKIQGSKMADGVLIENKDDDPPHIALGFKSLKSSGKYRYVWLLKGLAQPPAEEYSTKKDNVEHKTPKTKFTFMPRLFDGDWKRTADEGSDDFTGDDNWFSKVPGGEVSEADKAGLVFIIASAQEILDAADEGSGVGEYSALAINIFENAIAAAQSVVDDDKAGQSRVNDAAVTLIKGITVFEATKITG